MNTKLIFTALLGIILMGKAAAQSPAENFNLSHLNDTGKLQIVNRTVTSFEDGERKAIRFSDMGEDGIAWIEGLMFSGGVVEFDVKGSSEFQRSFVGLAFHGANDSTLDAVYFRPFNFLSNDSIRRIHAVQYVSHPEFSWKKLREEHPGQYEKAIGLLLDPEAWFHVKIIVNSPMVEVYVNDQETPCLRVEQLSSRKNGKLGLWVGYNSGGAFSNLSITHQP